MKSIPTFLFILIVHLSTESLANWQLGASGSSSNSSQTQSFKLSQTFFDHHKITFNQSNSKLMSDTTDTDSSTLKLAYRWNYSSDLKLSTRVNQMDEYNLFKSQGFGLQLIKKFQLADKTSNLSFAFDSSNKQYSSYSQLAFGQRQITLGFDQDLTDDFNFNFSYSAFQYQSESQIINRRLQGSTIQFSEIDSYISGLAVSSFSIGFDYSLNELATSFTLSIDRTDPANQTRFIGQSFQIDYNINEDLNLGMGISRSKEIGTTTNSDSTNWSLNYQLP